MNELEKMFRATDSAALYAARYLDYLSELLREIDGTEIENIVQALLTAYENHRTIFVIGNGGSAACASHWVNDLANGTKVPGQTPFRAISLTDNLASITALANDTGYENIFVAQLENLLQEGDVLIGISASGNSPNVVKAVEYANSMKAVTIGLVGFDGGQMKSRCRICLHIPTAKGEYGPVEDIQMILDHLITTYLRQHLQSRD
jgi:D-sedoheptulose 7-phosphate isomerase